MLAQQQAHALQEKTQEQSRIDREIRELELQLADKRKQHEALRAELEHVGHEPVHKKTGFAAFTPEQVEKRKYFDTTKRQFSEKESKLKDMDQHIRQLASDTEKDERDISQLLNGRASSGQILFIHIYRKVLRKIIRDNFYAVTECFTKASDR